MSTREEVHRELARALLPHTDFPGTAAYAILARYDIPALLDDLSDLNAENHRLLDQIDDLEVLLDER